MSAWHRLHRDETGSVMIETALVLPILVLAWLGTLDVRGLVLARTKLTSAVTTISDLATRPEALTTSSLDTIIAAGGMVMQPLAVSADTFSVTVASIGFDPDSGDPQLFWSHGNGDSPPVIDPQIARDLGAPGETVVAAAIRYQYRPLFGLFGDATITLDDIAVMRPRLVAGISYNGAMQTP